MSFAFRKVNMKSKKENKIEKGRKFFSAIEPENTMVLPPFLSSDIFGNFVSKILILFGIFRDLFPKHVF